jgi:hypothetical protein
MARTWAELLTSIATDAGRDEILRLGRQLHEVAEETTGAGETRREELLRQLVARIRWHLRAARYAIPHDAELLRMVDEHFK